MLSALVVADNYYLNYLLEDLAVDFVAREKYLDWWEDALLILNLCYLIEKVD